jgi:hypothetical protein
MSYRIWRPRRITSYETQIIRRLLQVDADAKPSAALLASIANLVVREQGDGGFEHDSLDFVGVHSHGAIIAAGLGLMTNDASVELILWADGDWPASATTS